MKSGPLESNNTDLCLKESRHRGLQSEYLSLLENKESKTLLGLLDNHKFQKVPGTKHWLLINTAKLTEEALGLQTGKITGKDDGRN